MTLVLVLNASHEQLHYVPLRRAISLILANKAELVQATGRRLRSALLELEEPAIIRLCRYVFVPYRTVRPTRRAILARDRRCQYCATSAVPLTVDHLVPRSRGGATSWENCVTACARCNQRKGNRTPAEAQMTLLYGPPSAPRTLLVEPDLGAAIAAIV